MPSRLAEHLVSRGLLSPQQATDALRAGSEPGAALDDVLLEWNLVPETALVRALAEVSGVRGVHLPDYEPNAEVAALVPAEISQRLGVVPLSIDGNTLHVASAYPIHKAELDEVGFLLGKGLMFWVAPRVRVREWMAALYGVPRTARDQQLLNQLSQPPAPSPAPALTPSSVAAAAPTPVASPQVEVEMPVLSSLSGEFANEPSEEPVTDPGLTLVPQIAPVTTSSTATTLENEPVPSVLEAMPEALRAAASAPLPTRLDRPVVPAPGWPPTPAAAAAVPGPLTTPARIATPVAAPAAAPGPAQPGPALNEELSLEESLAREMAAVLGPRAPFEPILLEVRKEPRRAGLNGTPAVARRTSQPEMPAVGATAETLGAVAAVPPAPTPVVTPTSPAPDLATARELLRTSAGSREALLDVVLRFALGTFEFAAAFAVIRGVATGWAARGDGSPPEKINAVSIPLDSVSVFRSVALTRSSYVGPVPADALSRQFLDQLSRSPRTVFLFPIFVKGRLVAMLYGDGGPKPLSQRRIADFVLFCQELPPAFERLILARRQEGAALRESLPEDLVVAPPPTPRAWSPGTPESTAGTGRAASSHARTQSEGERPPPDFDPILKRLMGPDATQRARAMAELARSPEASSRVLCQSFPGPTGWAKGPVADLPEADELGPIPGALSRLGRPAAQNLSALLDADDGVRRYFALLTAGSLPYPELVPGILRGLFDLEPDVSSAARAASGSFRRLPRFDTSLKSIRQELASIDALRRSLAARALGALHDREAIDGLIGLTGSDDDLCAQSAAQALTEITFATFGLDTQAWRRWWADNRGRRRAEWLLAGLRSVSIEHRIAALDELTRVTGDPYGYSAEGPPAMRELAMKKWEMALVQDPRLRRLD